MISSPTRSIKRLGPLVGAIDQGTCNTRFTVFVADSGELVTYHQLPLKPNTPKPGWLEADPEDMINCVTKCIDATIANLEKLDIEPNDIVAIGLATQRCTAIAWDKSTGNLIYPGCIMAADVRTKEMVADLKRCRNISERAVQTLSGLPISTYFSAIKFKWILENHAHEVKRLVDEERLLIGTTDSYLMWILTGGKNGGLHITDVTNASLTGLMNLEKLTWDKKLCELFGVPLNILPKIRSCSEIYGTLSISRLKGTPISGCIGDQQAALVGQNCWRPGQAKTSFGSGAFTLYNVGPKIMYSEKGLLSTVAYKLGEDKSAVYALEGVVKEAGSIISWLSSLGICNNLDYQQNATLDINYDSNVILMPSSSGGSTPHWGPNCDGMIIGIKTSNPDASNGHSIYQAALESVAFQNRDILEAMQNDSKITLTTLLSDGGMSQNNLMMQIQADFLGIPILRPSMTETTSLGAAIVAGMAKGVDIWKAEGTIDLTMDRFLPRLTDSQRDIRYERWKGAQQNSFNWTDTQSVSPSFASSVPYYNYNLTNHERFLRASVSPAIFLWSSFLLWKVSHSFSSN